MLSVSRVLPRALILRPGSHMRDRELVRLPRVAAEPYAAAPIFYTLFVKALLKREALAGDGEPIALFGLQAIAAA